MDRCGLKCSIGADSRISLNRKKPRKSTKCCTYVVPIIVSLSKLAAAFKDHCCMASVKIVLRKKENADGTYPLAIRITKDRRSSFIHLGRNIEEGQWDAVRQRVRKSHPNSARLNNLLLAKLAEANDTLLDLEKHKKDTSSKAIRNTIKPKGGISFFDLAGIYLDNLRANGNYNCLVADEPRINRFKEFLNGDDISFQEITVLLLTKFRAYLKATRNISERTIINHLLVIRTIFNQAIDGNLVDAKHYPFGKGKVSIKFPASNKIGLSPDEVKTLEELDLSDEPYLNHARNVWLFALYFAGMRVSDVFLLRWTDIQDNRLHYTMGKNAKPGSLKMPEKAIKILEHYEDDEPKNDLIFPELKILDDLDSRYEVKRKTSYAVKRINKALERIKGKTDITKPFTMHIARHTFGNISGDRISVQMLQKLYRHSSITTTIGYQASFIHKDADEALDAVIGA
jgi:integrase